MAFELNAAVFSQEAYDSAVQYATRYRVQAQMEIARNVLLYPFDINPDRYVYEWYALSAQYVAEYRPEGHTFNLGQFDQRLYDYARSYVSRFNDMYNAEGDDMENIDIPDQITCTLRYYNFDTYKFLQRDATSMYQQSAQYRMFQRMHDRANEGRMNNRVVGGVKSCRRRAKRLKRSRKTRRSSRR